MKQNKYDDPEFFNLYSLMPRSVGGLENAGEWPAFAALLPDLHDKCVLDLGCGYGWHCRYAREHGASRVLGVDLSENMLARAAELTDDTAIEYRCHSIEDFECGDERFDIVFSSLAFHYVAHYEAVCHKIFACLKPGGTFAFSVEHPVFTARAEQDWHYGLDGERLHWPVDNYHHEGVRRTNWLAENVIKYHRTIATYVNTLLAAGFHLTALLEPGPTLETVVEDPDRHDEARRPIFLILAAVKPG